MMNKKTAASANEWLIEISEAYNDIVLLVAHSDTFWDHHYGGNENKPQNIFQENGILRNKNGVLRTDDRAGCAMVYLLKDLGHSILITNDEEHGQKGSNWLMSCNPDIADKINFEHQFIVQLGRRNGSDFKCYHVGTEEFSNYVEQISGYTEPNCSSYTDIVTICRDICGVNLSIGYNEENSENEYLVIYDMRKYIEYMPKMVIRKKLPRF